MSNNDKKLNLWINPAEEDLWAKRMDLMETLDVIVKRGGLDGVQEEILAKCRENLENAKAALEPKLPFFKKHKIFWNLVHRVDEGIILLMPDEEVLSKAIDIKTFFGLSIKEKHIREEWLGGDGRKGKLTEVIDELETMGKLEELKKRLTEIAAGLKGKPTEELQEKLMETTAELKKLNSKKNMKQVRYILKEALRIVNDQMDHAFWILSLNSMVSLASAIFLGLLMFFFWSWCYSSQMDTSIAWTSLKEVAMPIAMLGGMGAYLSNLITREDFLFVKGPFWRYMLHYVISKPIISAFAAIFIYVLERSKLVFSIEPVATVAEQAPQLITLHVHHEAVGYVYAVLALASGFSSEKILRSMIDRVLKRLEQRAEKTKETQE